MTRLYILLLIFFILNKTVHSQSTIFATLEGTPLNTTGWNLTGGAYVGDTGGDANTDSDELIICGNTVWNSGAIFYNELIDLNTCAKWRVDFDFRMFDGNNADGIAFCLIDTPPTGFVSGWGVGIPGPANGLKVVLDTWNNCGFANPEIQVYNGIGYSECGAGIVSKIDASSGNSTLAGLRSTNYQSASILYNNGVVSVAINGIVLLTTPAITVSTTGYIGFTSSTGTNSDNHSIKNVRVYNNKAISDAGLDRTICSGESVTIGSVNNPNYTYNWVTSPELSSTSISDPTVTITNTTGVAQNYDFIVKAVITNDSTSCPSDPDTVTITVLPQPSVNLGNDVQICIGDTTTLTATGGTTYSWDNGLGNGNSKNVLPTATTTYVVTGTDANNCVNSDTIIVNVNPLPNINLGNDVQICIGDTTTLTATGGISYSWNNGLGNGNSKNVLPTATTTYFVIGTDANNCVNSDTIIVNVNPLPNINLGNDVQICIGDTTTLTATGGISYSWNNGLGNGNSKNVLPTATRTYFVIGTDANNCVNSDTIIVNVNTLPNINLGNDVQICFGDTTTLIATGGTSHSWDNGLGNGNNKNVAPTATTTYIVTGTDANNCVNSDTIIVNVNPLPNINLGNDVQICFGDTTTLTATGGTSYSWDNGLGNGNNKNVAPTTTTTYIVTGTDANNCVNTDTIIVNVNPLPNINLGNDVQICFGDTTTLTATGGTSYSWNNGLGNGNNKNVSPTVTTTYIVTGTDANNCVNSDTIIVNVNTLPIVNLGNDMQICIGDTVTLIATGGTTYSWNNGLGNGNNKNVSPTITTNYIVTVADSNNCLNSDTLEVMVKPNSSATISGNAIVCQNDNSPFVIFTGSDVNSEYIFTYNINGGFPQTLITLNSFEDSILINTNSPDSLVFNLISVTDQQTLCTSNQNSTVAIYIASLPSARIFGGDTLCQGDTTGQVRFLGSKGVAPYTFDYTINNGITLHTTSSGSNQAILPVPTSTTGIFTYNLTGVIESQYGCRNPLNESVTFLIAPNPIAQFSKSPEEIKESNNVVSFIDESTNANTYTWIFNDVDTSNLNSPRYQFDINDTSSYRILLFVESIFGCKDSVVDSIKIVDDELFYVPNAFTPNGDGLNDVFYPIITEGLDVLDYQLRIFNRWGELIFVSSEYQLGWDGTYKGAICQDGIYTWNIEIKSFNDAEKKQYMGQVILFSGR